MTYRTVFFVALVASVIALGAGLAHVYEIQNKMPLDRDAYFTVQRIYDGWNLLGIAIAIQLTAMIILAVMSRGDRAVMWSVLVAIFLVVAAQAVFWAVTFPANLATDQWTTIPDDWISVRRRWEYSHVAGAAFQFVAAIALFAAALMRQDRPGCRADARAG